MDNPQGKILKDYTPTSSAPQGAVTIEPSKGYEPVEYNPFASQRSSDQSDSSGSGGSRFPFEVIWNSETSEVKVAGGSYHYLNTNTDVPGKSGNGTYVYAVIKRSSGYAVDIEFSIEVTSTTKNPTNLDATNFFVEFSNVLLAEVITVDGSEKMVQRRAGNFTMVNQIINGRFAVWPLSSGGTI
jgi:hypothetical protein